MAQIFKAGDVVVLKSGGPKMTIEGPDIIVEWDAPSHPHDSKVVCVFFNAKGERQTEIFEQDMLEK